MIIDTFMANSLGIPSHQANGTTGPVPMCTILRLNSFSSGKIFLQITELTNIMVIHKAIIRIELKLTKLRFRQLVDD